jgi:broad specificity phosphatase PhoE
MAALPADELRIVSSPALRCRQTAAAIASALRQPPSVETEGSLIEIDYGAWDGLTPDECRARDPGLRAAWEADPGAVRCPSGESGADVAARSLPVLAAIGAWLAGRRARLAIVVAHNAVNRLYLADLLGWPLSEYRRRVVQAPGGYNAITYSDAGTVLRRLNAAADPPDTGSAGAAV